MRTLLNAILGYTALWLEDLPAQAAPDLAASLALIHAEGQSLLKQVNELLDASRLLDATYTAGIGERLRAELSAPVEFVVSKVRALGAVPSAGRRYGGCRAARDWACFVVREQPGARRRR
jgi:signal transduction histidine kinase